MIGKGLILVALIIFACTDDQKQQAVEIDIIAVDSSRVIQLADGYLSEKPVTVTAAYCQRSAGGPHDYYSEGDYWWPNPDDPDGPYIRKDGMSNPGNFLAHRKAMRRMSQIVPALVAAYRITGEEKYASQALQHVNAWFVNEATRMNPNLLYAQAIKGRVTGRGIGIIDTIHLVEVARAVAVLEELDYLNQTNADAIKKWFADYLDWITSHPYGKDERDNGNNHSTCWAMQVAAYARLTGNDRWLDSVRVFYKTTLLEQMAGDGSFPEELDRTKPYGYSLFNLDAMAMVCEIASTENDDLWAYQTTDGRGVQKAMEFMYPFIEDKLSWPFEPDVMYFEHWPMRHPALLFAGRAYGEPKYIQLWKSLNPDTDTDEIIRNFFIRQPVLWMEKWK